MSHQGQTRFAQTVTLMAHNADFCRLRISKYPANAHERNYFSTLGIDNIKEAPIVFYFSGD